MLKSNKKSSLEASRNRAGYTFVIHWLLGLSLFFVYPLFNSILYTFSDVTIQAGAIETDFIGLQKLRELILEDSGYIDYLRDSIGMMFYSLPFIIAISLLLAVLLNQKFKGRAIFRAIFFLPVIFTNSVVMLQLNTEYVKMPLFSSDEAGVGIIDYTSIITQLNVPTEISPILIFLLSNTINLIWSCGVQTILFLAGLQSIPPSLYEVSKIEGANKWEEFWRITVPSLRHIISLVLIYTMIELFVDSKNKLVSQAYNKMIQQDYNTSSAMLWIYFVVVLILIGAVLALYQRYCIKKWE
ncbi:MAG: sugar ABC transporter permease [Clostridia bacterium]|nr:sugar ABC transporter permease [Clostridia bacterium]